MKKLRKYKFEAVRTGYWCPGDKYLEIISNAVFGKISDGDIVAISEKALSVATGSLVDESNIKPGYMAKLLTLIWMRDVWGYWLGKVCRLRRQNILRLRKYPFMLGSSHKQTVISHAGFLASLMWGSEGGIDGSNVPYSYVSLPLREPANKANEIQDHLKKKQGIDVTILITDTDKTYSLRNFHFTHRPVRMKHIHCFLGFVGYVIGRTMGLKKRSTPIAFSRNGINIEVALKLAEIIHRIRGSGAGPTVWDMANKFGAMPNEVSWKMLRAIEHKPIVIVRTFKKKRFSIF